MFLEYFRKIWRGPRRYEIGYLNNLNVGAGETSILDIPNTEKVMKYCQQISQIFLEINLR